MIPGIDYSSDDTQADEVRFMRIESFRYIETKIDVVLDAPGYNPRESDSGRHIREKQRKKRRRL